MLLIDLLIELVDAVVTILLFSFILAKVSFPGSLFLIGFCSLPLFIGAVRGIVKDARSTE